MSAGFAPRLQPNAPKPGWSTGKKWLIGCGGCLGLIILVVVVLAVLAGMGVSQLQKISGESVSGIFGPNYKPEGYVSMGMPINSPKLNRLAMLINGKNGLVVFAAQTKLGDKEFQELRNQTGQLAALKAFEALAKSSAQSNSSQGKFKSIRMDKLYSHVLGPLKQFTVCNATMAQELKDGSTTYSPISIALVPEVDNHLVVLVATDSQNHSSDPDAKFDTEQKALEDEVFKIIQDSELDEHLSLYVAPQAAAPSKPATTPAKAQPKAKK